MSNSNKEQIFIRFTSAPESYDYGNTETVATVGKMKNGDQLRKVRIWSENSLYYQEPRYRSGLYLSVSLDKLEEIHDLVGEVDMVEARKPDPFSPEMTAEEWCSFVR